MFIKNGSFKKYTHIITYVPPTINTQPVGETKNVGSDFKLKIAAQGSRPLTYQWFKNGFPIANQTSEELNLTNLQLTDDANYYCEVRNNGYLVTSKTVKLDVLVNISFASHPSNVQVNPNSNVSFTASAVGTPPITYKWYKNSVLYPGTTDKIFINNVTKNEEGNYFAVASNLLTSITSNSASLVVNNEIVIKDQPDNTTLNVGNNLTLSLSCVGTFPISAQWRKNDTNYGVLSVVNTGDVKLQISNVQYTDEGNYDCVLSNVVGSVTSNKAIFYINRPPTFTVNPVSGIGYTGNSFTFTSNATGTNPISYQWTKDNSGNVNGATSKNYTLNNLVFANSGNYACIASNLYGTVTSTFASLSVYELFSTFSKIFAGQANSFFLGTDGIVYACGGNNFGQLGDGTQVDKTTLVKINLPPVSMIAAGENHTFFLGTDGTVSACGRNHYGQLGDGTKVDKPTLVKINLPPVSMIAAAIDHYTVFLGTDGTVSACGRNRYGQLGDGTRVDKTTPVKINLPPVSMIAAGLAHTLLLGTDGTVSVCGDNYYGQLGDGTKVLKPTPVKINLPPVSMIAAGEDHTLLLGTDGTVSACGINNFGQLGDGTKVDKPTPVKINLPPVSMIAAGKYHTLLLGTDGTVSACGGNNFGQLGDGTQVTKTTQVKINLPPVSMIAAGNSHTLSLGTDGTAYGYGGNNFGQLGDGTKGNQTSPVKISVIL
jgi:alpha-tubulin suppressor-like RCC1 family protein